MTISLYDLSVPTFLQTTRAIGAVLDIAINHCAKTGANPDDLVDARLVPDMAPFHFQIEAMTHHAVWGVEAVKTGAFNPPPLVGPIPFKDLRAMVANAVTALEAFTPEDINTYANKKLDIVIYRPIDANNVTNSGWGPQTFPLTSETFLLTYSLPNFYFHAVTAYDLLRANGIPIGKAHYTGQLRATRP